MICFSKIETGIARSLHRFLEECQIVENTRNTIAADFRSSCSRFTQPRTEALNLVMKSLAQDVLEPLPGS
jgi:cysteine sulfinate desulfinase/cysteine desulfurase-like protein